MEDENEKDREAPLTSARRTYDKFFASDEESNSSTHAEEQSWPLNQFGRGQAVSSVQYSSVSTGWYPKPMQCWRLLGGGKEKKKIGPTTKAHESGNGNYLIFLKTPEQKSSILFFP